MFRKKNVLCVPLLASGCMLTVTGETGQIGAGGGGELVLEMPVPVGTELMCTQGAHGSYSHSSESTRYDLDFDTPNDVDEEVYAPATGVAYVHTESASSGFGYHVNIDVGGGQYVVIAHLSDIFITDGAEVAVGQMIGYEGATGWADGDHIHVGLHEGNAATMADQGVSVPATWRASDASHGEGGEIFSSEEFICGLKSSGDAHNGHFYESSLAVPLWHPDGTLVKVPDNAKVHLLDEGARWIENEEIFWSHGYDFDEMVLISDEELACLGRGSDISSIGFIDAIFDNEDQLWLLVGLSDDPNRYRIKVQGTGWEAVMASWGLSYSQSNWPDEYSDQSSYLTDWEPASGYAPLRDGTLVTEASSADVYVIMNNRALPIRDWETFLMLGYWDRMILTVDDGVVAELHNELGNCAADLWCVDQEAITTCGGGLELDGGGMGGEPSDDTGASSDDNESNDDSDMGSDIPDEEDDEDTSTRADEGHCSGVDACIRDLDGDGVDETLLMADDLWLTSSVQGDPAYIYANGGCFDGSLTTSDLVYTNVGGYYEIDFKSFTSGCTVELSLIASTGTDGASPTSSMSNWYWWQNAAFCSAGQALCELKDNGTSWEEWLVKVDWDPTSGLQTAGNGYITNGQL